MSEIAPLFVVLLVITAVPTLAFLLAFRGRDATSSTPGTTMVAFSVATLTAFFAGMFDSTGLWLVPVSLIVIAAICRNCQFTRRISRRCIAAMAMVAGLGFVCWWGSIIWQINEQLELHPVISLVDRLGYEKDTRVEADLSSIHRPWSRTFESIQLEKFPTLGVVSNSEPTVVEKLIYDAASMDGVRKRGRQFEHLLYTHRSIEQQFSNAAGFGIGRARIIPYQHWQLDLDEVPLIALPGNHIRGEADSLDSVETSVDGIDYMPWHNSNLVSFVSPTATAAVGWDQERDRPDLSRVVGFQPHAFVARPQPPATAGDKHTPWRIDGLALVSLLKHRPAVAYVSDHLPNMDELASVPTRPLDDFESGALDKLRAGEELVVRSGSSHIDMVGSIRAAYQCLECHQVPRGTLLGVFSYRLSRPDFSSPASEDVEH
ncbi:MAG: hypothetical protein AABP62_25900 [Planctomycetota bacterium]